MAFHALRDPDARHLAPALERALSETVRCGTCFNLSANDPCVMCSDPERESRRILVVEEPRDVEAVGAVADMFQIGARNMANTALLVEVGKSGIPVLLKRGFAATLRELLLAAEFVLAEGNPNVVLCERGIRGFDPSTRYVLDVGAVARLKRTTHLPVIVDLALETA